MNKITSALAPATISTIAISLMAGSLEAALTPPPRVQAPPSVQFSGLSSTYGELGRVGPITLLSGSSASLVDFYSQLAASQEELTGEFQRVLSDYAWELYAR